MQGHAASNLIPVIAANRIGEETVEPCPENGMQKSALNFYGSSFITDNTGALCAELPGGEEGVLVSTFDLDALKADRLNGTFQRPQTGDVCKNCRKMTKAGESEWICSVISKTIYVFIRIS